jgi:hypothetical protein
VRITRGGKILARLAGNIAAILPQALPQALRLVND